MKSFVFIQLVFILIINVAYSQAEPTNSDPSVIQRYEANRQTFRGGAESELKRYLEKRGTVSNSSAYTVKKKQVEDNERRLREIERQLDQRIENQNKEKARLQALVSEAQRKVDAEQSRINSEQNKISAARSNQSLLNSFRSKLLVWFFPMLAGIGALTASAMSFLSPISSFPDLGGFSALTYFAFFSVWAINIFIVLWNKERMFMGRNKWMVSGVLIVFLALFSTPLFAQNKIEEDEFLSQLELVDKILGQSDYQRYIAILELKPQAQIKLPALSPSGEYLRPFRMVKVDSGEYYFTLGALYVHEQRIGDAVSAIKKIKVDNLASASRNPVITAAIKFLIDRNQTDAASTLLADSLGKLSDVSSLVDLSLFLDSKGMQASSDDILERAISVAEYYAEFIELAQVFYRNGNVEKSGNAIDQAIFSTSSVSSLIELSKLARDLKFPDKSSEALSRAIDNANTTDELISLSEYAAQIQNSEKAILALQRALKRVKTPQDLLNVAAAAIEGSHADIIAGVNDRAGSLLDDIARIRLIDLYRKYNHMENAVANFEALLLSVNKADSDRQERLLRYADLAIERDMYEQARNAVERLARLAGKQRNSISVKPNQSLSVVKNIPEQSSIELQLYYGLLNEKMAFNDKAESSYTSSVKRSLQGILDSYGYETPENLNNFYLLGRIWKTLGETEKLEVLDLVYTDIEEEILKKIRADYDNKLLAMQRVKDNEAYRKLDKEKSRLAKYEESLETRRDNDLIDVRQNIDNLIARLQSLQEVLPQKIQELEQYRIYAKQARKEIILQNVSIIASSIFLLILLFGSAYWAYSKYAKHLHASKTFGFISKYIEIMGWVRVLSIIGVVSGFISIVFGQVLQIFQRSSEELAKRNEKLASDTNIQRNVVVHQKEQLSAGE